VVVEEVELLMSTLQLGARKAGKDGRLYTMMCLEFGAAGLAFNGYSGGIHAF
jgi:hypothetical protein